VSQSTLTHRWRISHTQTWHCKTHTRSAPKLAFTAYNSRFTGGFNLQSAGRHTTQQDRTNTHTRVNTHTCFQSGSAVLVYRSFLRAPEAHSCFTGSRARSHVSGCVPLNTHTHNNKHTQPERSDLLHHYSHHATTAAVFL